MGEDCHKIEPRPSVIPEPAEFMGKHILVIWVPGGETRPYKSPVLFGKNELGKAYYIRTGSVTKRAEGVDEQQLLSLAAKVPFDDRICHAASLDDVGNNMEENIFHGPIHKQLKDALRYLETQVIRKRITKIDGQAEAPKTYNYPYAALEEILSIAVVQDG